MILDKIAAATRERVKTVKEKVPFEEVKEKALAMAADEIHTFPFEKALSGKKWALSVR